MNNTHVSLCTPDRAPSPWRPFQRPAANEVQVQVEDRLACALSVVRDEAELAEALMLGDGCSSNHQVAENRRVLGRRGAQARESVSVLWYDEDMRRGHGVDVPEGEAELVLEDDLARYVPAKQGKLTAGEEAS